MVTFYDLYVYPNIIFSGTCLNNNVSIIQGFISTNCSTLLNYVFVTRRDCFPINGGIVSERDYNKRDGNICVITHNQYQKIYNRIGTSEHMFEFYKKSDISFEEYISYIFQITLLLCFILMCFYVLIKNLRRTTQEVVIQPLYIVSEQNRRRTTNCPQRRNDYQIVTDEEATSEIYEKECAVCIEKMEPRQELAKLPCNHIYHKDCIIQWFQNSSRCPLCNNEG